MRNYASKINKRVVRFRTPSSFKVRQSQAIKQQPKAMPPYQPPNRGQSGKVS